MENSLTEEEKVSVVNCDAPQTHRHDDGFKARKVQGS